MQSSILITDNIFDMWSATTATLSELALRPGRNDDNAGNLSNTDQYEIVDAVIYIQVVSPGA